VLYIQGPHNATLTDEVQALTNDWGTKQIIFADTMCNTTLQDGPYFGTRSGLHRAWRLYDDYTNSFVLSSVPSADDPNTYEPLTVNSGNQFGVLSVAVPSRLFYTPTVERPLAGYRVGVKDEYNIKGLLTTFGSRSYAMTYPPANETSGAIQLLIDQGAIIVGKTKLSMYASADFTVSQWIDYQLPIVSLKYPVTHPKDADHGRMCEGTVIKYLEPLLQDRAPQ
jgi:hypothetical protein